MVGVKVQIRLTADVDADRLAWKAPLAATSRFARAVTDLIRKFNDIRDRLLLDDYHAIPLEARERWGQASEAMYDNILRLGKSNGLASGAFMERSARERLLHQAIDPQVRQAQEIVAQVETSLLKVGQEITATLTGGGSLQRLSQQQPQRGGGTLGNGGRDRGAE